MLRFLMILLAAIAAIVPSASGQEPVKLAELARVDVKADDEVGSLDDGHILEGGGTIVRMNWIPESERPRGYVFEFPVTCLGWRPAACRFTPARSGTVTLSLMGPWVEAERGLIYRQELIWDNIRVEGAALANGGFETPRVEGSADDPWLGLGTIEAQTSQVPAVEGTHYARTWHNQPLAARLQVTAGRPVTIRLSARAFRPAGLPEMKRIAGRTSPAHRAARRFLRGANLGNGLEAPPGQNWGVRYTPADLRLIRDEGFDHARIPVGWHHYTGPGPEFRIKPEIFARVDELVNSGLAQGLGVIINIHHFDDFTTDPKGQTPRFLAIWKQVAAHYAKAPEGLVFELLNEPKDAATTAVINPIWADAIRTIRAVDPGRTIFVGPGKWNSVDELSLLQLPDDDANLIVTVHSYEPFLFTHQGATWSGPNTKVTGIRFPGPPPAPLIPAPTLKVDRWVFDWVQRYNTEPTATNECGPRTIQAAVDKAREWSEYYGRPIHFGEFGCFTTADPVSRANYYRTFREAAEKAGIGWAMWDWKAGFRYWEEKASRPAPGMREALFGRSTARTSR